MSAGDGFDEAAANAAGYRIDPASGAPAWFVPARQSRPNLPTDECPFCPGGLEAPANYEVLAFPNRWPPFEDGRAEIVLYTSDHNSSFAELSPSHARKVIDLWAQRSAEMAKRDDVACVLVFENRGSEVGATISHPHGQIYAFDIIPPAVANELERSTSTTFTPPSTTHIVARHGSWQAWVPDAAAWPYELLLAPTTLSPDLPSLDPASRNDLASILIEVIGRLDGLFDAPMPFMMWIHQQPFDGTSHHNMPVHVHIAPLLRSPETQRFVAAGELGSGVFFNPIEPTVAAAHLRDVAQ